MRTEFSHVPFDGDLTDDKIVCQNCGWSWNKKDGGNDLFMCHRCNADNSDFYLLNSNFEGADYSQAITQGVSAIGSIGSSVAQAKATKEASKTNTQREVDAVCGKDKSRAWSKKKKQAYISCKNSVLDKLDTNVRLSNQQQQKNQQLQQLALLQKNKQQRNQTYLIIGVVALILGVVIYKKINK